MNDVFNLRDKRGIPIAKGDVLRVFHFVGARRRRHYMFKQCLGEVHLGKDATQPHLKMSHLDLTGEYYTEFADGRCLPDYEIVQSIACDHEDRPRATPPQPEGRAGA